MSTGSDSLCLQCGLCCDGTLFQHATLVEAEVGWAWGQGFHVVRGANGAPAFRQPCPAFGEGCCSVYAERPQTCRAFRCRLLVDHEAGRLTLAACLAIVGRARAAVADLEAVLGLGPGEFSRRRFVHLRTAAVRADDLDRAEALTAAATPLHALLVESFADPEAS